MSPSALRESISALAAGPDVAPELTPERALEIHPLSPSQETASQSDLSAAHTRPDREVQIRWSREPVRTRLRTLRRARYMLAGMSEPITRAIAPELSRTPADTLAAELFPLLEAMRYLERSATAVLRPRRLGRRGRPFWLSGVDAEIRRIPFGRILILGPSNYPLFLPGVQAAQALAAGNAVIWKPGRGGAAVAHVFAEALVAAGLPQGLLTITGESVSAAESAMEDGVDKVFLTGSVETGRTLLHTLAETLTPAVVELSGADAAIVLPGADLGRVARALSFGMRLNGSATCMAPRRVLLVDQTLADRDRLLAQLRHELAAVPAVNLPASTRQQLRSLVEDALTRGAHLFEPIDLSDAPLRPVILLNSTPAMRVAQADIFAPVLTFIDLPNIDDVVRAQDACPFALTVSIFGPESAARALAPHLTTGTVLINDIIVPTADPRVPFGGRKGSGFGVTRGAEGLLEMTAVQVVSVRHGRDTRHYDATDTRHQELFSGVARLVHGNQSWGAKFRELRHVARAGRKMGQKSPDPTSSGSGANLK